MLTYYARFEPADEGGYVVTFRDIPEAITQADSLEEAHAMAADALLTAMDFYFEDKRPVPLPSKAKAKEQPVELPTSTSVKVLLLNEMLAQNVRPSMLARKMRTTPQEVNRIVDLHHATKIDTLTAAFAELGKKLVLRVV